MPTEAEVNAFAAKLKEFRGSLGESDQRLLDAMYYAAMGAHAEKDDDVHAYWVEVGPRSLAVGRPSVGWSLRPWGTAYNTYSL